MAPRNAESSRAAREHAAQGILAAAAKVFARRGYAGTKVADIAAEAGVSSGLVHHYFDTKAHVFRTLVEQVMSSATETPKQALEREGGPADNLRWMIEQMVLGATRAPEYYMLTLQVQTSEAVPEDIRALVTGGGGEGLELMAEVVARAQRVGEARDGDPLALMAHVLATVQGLAIQMAFSGEAPVGVPDVDVVLGMLAPRVADAGGAR